MTRSLFPVFVVLLGLSGCSAEMPYVWVTALPASGETTEPAIRPNDRIFVLVQGQDAVTGELQVRADGSIVQPLMGKVDVAGLTAKGAAQRITDRLRGAIVNPQVTVAIVVTSPSKISVVGEVRRPGHFEVDSEEGVLNALARAEGLTDFADKDGIFVIRRHPSLERIRFHYRDLVGGEAASVSFRLRDGDVVVVE